MNVPPHPDQASMLSCFNIRFGQSVGTAFFLRRSDELLIVTAAHVVDGLAAGDSFAFRYDQGWVLSECLGIKNCEKGCDLAILRPNGPIKTLYANQGFEPQQLGVGFMYGQPVAYLGFPLGLSVEMGITPAGEYVPAGTGDANLHLPFCKQGNVGGIIKREWGPEIYVDSLINHGFSGGPLLVNSTSADNQKRLGVGGVVVRYHYDSVSKIHKLGPDGGVVVDNHSFVRPNSGYAVAIGTKRILEMAESF